MPMVRSVITKRDKALNLYRGDIMDKEKMPKLTDEEMLILMIVFDSVIKDIRKGNDKKFANAFHSRFPDVPKEDVEKAFDILRKSQNYALKCENCRFYDVKEKECSMGNNSERDNDPKLGCWDYEE